MQCRRQNEKISETNIFRIRGIEDSEAGELNAILTRLAKIEAKLTTTTPPKCYPPLQRVPFNNGRVNQQTQGQGKWFKCGKPGHFSRECLSQVQCYI